MKWQRLASPVILVFGICLRAFVVLSQGLNSDEVKSIGFILDRSWTSIIWDNYPPLFYSLGKALVLLPFNPILSLKVFVCLVSAASLFLFFHFLRKQDSFPAWAYLLIAIWPASFFTSTLVRPLILIEFFTILNFSTFEDLSQGRRHRPIWILFFLSLVGLMLSTYASALYIAYLGFLAWRRKLLSDMTAQQRATSLFLLLASCGLLLAIRWKNLNWLFLDVSISDKGQASAYLLRNLLASDWILLILFVALSFWRRSIESISLIVIVIAINTFSGMAAYEARFLLFFYPLLFWQLIQHLQSLSPGWLRHFAYLAVLILTVQSALTIARTQRSGIADLQTISRSPGIETIAGPLDKKVMPFLFSEKQIAESKEALLQTCCRGCLVFEYLGFSKLSSADMQEKLQSLRFETVNKGKAGLGSLEPFEYLEIRRPCP